MDKYLSSTDVKAFPASWRSADSGDPESSLTTETSLRRLAYARFSHRSTAYFDTSSNEFVIVVDGYVFVVSPAGSKPTTFLEAIDSIVSQFSDAEPPATDIYAGITVAAMGMTVGKTQYAAENGLFEQLRPSNGTNNALDGVPAESETSLFYGLQLSNVEPKGQGLSAYLHILHRDKGEGDTYGDWYIPEEAKFVTDTNQVQNRGGDVSIGTRLDTKKVYVTPSGDMSSEETEPTYSQLTPDMLEVVSSKASGGASRLRVIANRISFSALAEEGGGTSDASLAKSAEALGISDGAKIEVSAPTVSIGDGKSNSIGMSKGKPIEVVGAKGITLDNSSASESEPIEAKSAAMSINADSVTVSGIRTASGAKVDVKGSLSVLRRGVFGTQPDGSGDASLSDAVGAVCLFWNGMEYKAIEVSSGVFVSALTTLGLMRSLGDSYRSFFLVKGVQLHDVYTTSDGEGLTPLPDEPDEKNYSQLWDLTFTFSPVRPGTWSYLAIGRLIGEWHGEAREGRVKNVLDANGYPYDAMLHSEFSSITPMTFAALLDKQVRTSTVPESTVNDWFR